VRLLGKYGSSMVLDRANAGCLDDHLVFVDQLTLAQKAQIILDVASELSYLHAMAIIHRDLAPRYILLI